MTHQIVSKEDMKLLDRLTMREKNLTSFELMVQAGTFLFEYIKNQELYTSEDHILLISGNGKNGGDGLVIVHELCKLGLRPSLLFVGKEEKLCEESKQMLVRLNEYHLETKRIYDDDDESYIEYINNATLILDGMFGIGLSKPVKNYRKQIIEAVNRSYARVISIDLPSGINANNGLKMGASIHADDTLIVQNLKQGNLLNDALDYHGKSHRVDVQILQNMTFEPQLLLPLNYLKNKIKKRRHNSYKYVFGNVLTIGGSKGMMGAPFLAGFASLKTGSGLSTVFTNEKYLKYACNIYPELMFDTFTGLEDIPIKVQKMSCVIFGPGLGKNDDLNLDILSYLLNTDIPLVIDADGIYYLKQLIKEYSQRENIIITPHYKEMASFLGLSTEEVKQEPLLLSKNIAHKYNITVVLKGTCTIITNNNETFFSTHGNPGLASAGTGDVLSGIIGSLLGRGMDPLDSAKTGVLIHSYAAKYACDKYGEESLTATNLLEFLPEVLQYAKG